MILQCCHYPWPVVAKHSVMLLASSRGCIRRLVMVLEELLSSPICARLLVDIRNIDLGLNDNHSSSSVATEKRGRQVLL